MAFQFTRESLQTIRRRTGSLLQAFSYGIISASSANSVTSSTIRSHPSNSLAGHWAAVTDGYSIYETKMINYNEQESGVIQVTPDWASPPGVGDYLEIWPPDLLPDQVNNAINLAILDAQSVTFVPARETGPTLSSDRLEIDLSSSALTKVSGVQYKSATGVWTVYQHASHLDWMEEQRFAWTLLGSTIFLSPAIPTDILSADISISGYRGPALLVTDTGLAEVRSDFLTYFAASVCARIQSEEDGKQASAADRWLQKAMDVKSQMDPSFAPNTYDIEA